MKILLLITISTFFCTASSSIFSQPNITNSAYEGLKDNFNKEICCNKSNYYPDNINAFSNTIESKKITRGFVYLTFGFHEISNFGFGYNINENWGAALKANIFILRGTSFFNGAAGMGVKIHRRIFANRRSRLFDTINLEASIGSNNFSKGITRCKDIQLNLASESENEDDIHIYYSAGLGYSSENRNGSQILPTIKLGLIFNF